MKEFEFHGACDLVLLKSEEFDMDIHVRTTIRYDYSFISQAAIRHKDDVFEVASWGEYMLNDMATVEMPAMMGDYLVTMEKVNKKKQVFNVQLGNGVDINIVSFKDYVSVKVENATKAMFADAVGMMGSYETGDMLARDGKTVVEDPNEFGFEWQVRPDQDHVLFSADRYPTWPVKCEMPPTNAVQARRRLGEHSVTREQAESACRDWREEKSKCIDDVLKTGDLELADGF
jgi:hypothetical protein